MLHILANIFTLTLLEIILGIDNLVFISIVILRLPETQRDSARRLGLLLAMLMRILLLFVLSAAAHMQETWFHVFGMGFSLRDIIFIFGGLFLIFKATQEMHDVLEEEAPPQALTRVKKSNHHRYVYALLQIMIFDIVFSLDSVMTAIGLSTHFWVMATAIVIAMGCMFFASKRVCAFLQKHPTLKILALSFVLLIGIMLLSDGFGYHLPRQYIYFAICYALFIEILNTIYKSRHKEKSKQYGKDNKP